MAYTVAYYTDTGIKRKTNQDSLVIRKADTDKGEVIMIALCDGMGGLTAGELASKETVLKFASWFEDDLPRIIYSGLYASIIYSDWGRILRDIDEAIVRHSQEKGCMLGTTATVLLLFRGNYYIAHVGDTRCYQIFDNHVTQLTRDDSVVELELRAGIITEEQAKTDKRRNVLTECIGGERGVTPSFYEGEIGNAAGFLLCTDGFWHLNPHENLLELVSSLRSGSEETMTNALIDLTEHAKQEKEADNITSAVIGITED